MPPAPGVTSTAMRDGQQPELKLPVAAGRGCCQCQWVAPSERFKEASGPGFRLSRCLVPNLAAAEIMAAAHDSFQEAQAGLVKQMPPA